MVTKNPNSAEILGMDFKVTSVQLGQDKWNESAKWNVTLECGHKAISIEYTKGCGHRFLDKRKMNRSFGLRPFPKGWTWGSQPQVFGRMTNHAVNVWDRCSSPIPPDVHEVLHSLLLDASAGEQTFKSWCAEYDYCDDSIQDHKLYLKCQEIHDKLASLLTQTIIENLRDYFYEIEY